MLSRFCRVVAPALMLMFSTVCLGQETAQQNSAAAPAKSVEPSKDKDDQAASKPATSVKSVDATKHAQVVRLGVEFLLKKGIAADGSYSKQLGPAVTGMCTTALLKNGVPVDHQQVQKSLKYLEGFIQKDGGIYAPGSSLRNYETSIAVMCFAEANVGNRYDKTIEEAVGFLRGIQFDEGEGHGRTSQFYGGQGYGKHKRPDASNTSFFMDALKKHGAGPEDSDMKKALVFMSRCQNLKTEYNTEEFTKTIDADDVGGSIYTPVGPETKAPPRDSGGLRSYASMTYAGLKSFLYAGLKKDDIRVKAAMDWIARHYDLDSNPGMGLQGLYYYYHVFAKALDANGERFVMDSAKVKHNWRADLVAALKKRQREDGSWVNEADRWFEGDPNLVTSYALLGLSYCKPELDK